MEHLPTTSIQEMLADSQFRIERSATPSLEAMEADLRRRFDGGERWELAIVEESMDYMGAVAPHLRHGMVLLRRASTQGTYEGIYYPRADCGVDLAAARTTARMLCLLLGTDQVDRLYDDFLRYYPKVIVWDLGTDNPRMEPID